MAAIAATLRAQAADSTRCHDSTAPVPEAPVVETTNESNMHSNLRPAADACAGNLAVDADLGMNYGLCTTPQPGRENVSGAC